MSGYLYLFFQIWVWILASFILGWVSHWFLCCRGKDNAEANAADQGSVKEELSSENIAVVASTSTSVDESWKPHGYAGPPDKPDDLKRIKGVGSVIEETLNDLGVYQFEQVANWTENNVAWIENFLAFPGRIGREGWVDQSKTLMTGGTTEFAKRVDKGDVDYS